MARPIIIAALLASALPAAASAGNAFTNHTTAGLRCRLASASKDTAMTITLEPKERVTVAGTYQSIRCGEPVVRERFALGEGREYRFIRMPDGNRITLEPL